MTDKKLNTLLNDAEALKIIAEAAVQYEAYKALTALANHSTHLENNTNQSKDWMHPIGLSFIKGI